MKKASGFLSLVLVSGLLLSAEAAWSVSGSRRVISASIDRIHDIKALTEDADILGIHREEGTVQIRLPVHEAELLREHGLEVADMESHGLVAGSMLQGYKSPAESEAVLRHLVDQYPDLARLREIGRSHEQRPVFALELGIQDSVRLKPSILFNGMHHAREVMTTEVVLDMAEYLLANSTEPEVHGWLENYRIILVPQVNPDGGHRVHSGDRWWRKNAWKSGSTVWGVDLNRNYPAMWNGCGGSSGSVFAQDYRGPTAASEPETQAMMALVAETQPVFNISYHSYSELIIYPYGCERQQNPSVELFRTIAEEMGEQIRDDRGQSGTYQIGTAPELLYEADGTDLDFQWQEYNVIAYTLEVNSRSQGFQPDYGTWRDKTVESQRGGWMTLIRRMEEGGVRAVFKEGTLHSLILEKETGEGFIRWDKGRGPLESLRHGQLLYQLLDNGRYRLRAVREGQKEQVIVFHVNGSLTDLGNL